ncbi:hypothetical protein B0T19DRAFT_442560 [Cercophora scortea]|uniref:Prolyl 4-hydroxylase alpha subunit Fe(2+) 2OG dioxygenase domain-containing protein n=1 Tax=Cercophora scortea TaxID=314031 RepID=A0AAE0IQH5_9PEZI|nr:hypothetical protein B0T19DRAFT_442560 [Cercophora scortea]
MEVQAPGSVLAPDPAAAPAAVADDATTSMAPASQAESEDFASSPLSTDDYHVSLTADLLKNLEDIKAAGSFAAFHSLQGNSIHPDIHVHGVGTINLPLREDQARQLIDKARQAPYGKGSDTIVDTSVRNTWELDPSQFELRAARWANDIQTLCKFVAKDLGITSPVSAELYKMLVYEKGAMFKAHTDTEKIPGMFGTLIVCLPSPHEGGDLVVKHRGDKMIFKTSETQPSLHVLPVTSGYRWVLTYNLAIEPGLERPSASLTSAGPQQLRHTLRRWLAQDPDADCDEIFEHLYFILDHQYTEANISLRGLKGADLARVQCLQAVAAELEIDVFLAVLEKTEEGTHEIEEVFESSVSIKKLGNLIQEGRDLFDTNDCGESEYSGFMGNSGPTATHWYRATVAVLVPREHTDNFILGDINAADSQTLLPHYIKKCSSPDSNTKARGLAAVRQLARKAWATSKDELHRGYYGPLKVDQDTVQRVLKLALDLQEYTLFNDVLGWLKAEVGVDTFTNVKMAMMSDFDAIKPSLLGNILARPVADRYSCLSALTTEVDKATYPSMFDLAHQVVADSIEACRTASVGERVAASIVKMARTYHDLSFFKTNLVPVLEQKMNQTPFALTASQHFIAYAVKGEFELSESIELYRTLVKSVITALSLDTLRSKEAILQAAKAAKFSHTQGFRPALLQPFHALNPERLALLFAHCIQYKWEDLTMQLSFKLVAQVNNITPSELAPFWLPFLHSLIRTLETAGIPLSTPRYQQIAGAILEAYVDNYVGAEPANASPNLAQPTVPCCCRDCTELNQFLAAPNERTARFPVSKPRRHHLHQQLDNMRANCTHTTERHTHPETLVVTKQLRAQEVASTDWQARFAAARVEMAKFDASKLRMLLGADYERITSMGHLRAPGSRVQISLPGIDTLVPGPALGTGAGVKRKAGSYWE